MKSKGLMLLAMLLLASCGKQVTSESASESPGVQQSQPVPPQAQAQEQSVLMFWDTFRAAALRNDRSALLAITRFPFATRGPTDADPTTSHDQAAFEQLLPRILEQDTGLSAEPQTVRQYIERHPELPTIAIGAGRSIPVAADATEFSAGPLNFEKAGDRWYWVAAYLDE